MPTNEDRKAMSAKLRDMAKERVWHDNYFIAYLIYALSMDLHASVGEILERLADLIEPEPERTCEWTWEHSGPLFDSFKCSECLYEFYEPRCVHGYSDLVANYCPNCGCRIKEEPDA